MVDGDDGEEFPPKLTELLLYGYRLSNADVYPLSDAVIYRLSNAWCNQVVYALCGEYVCV